jgi:hypothetical protein
MPPTKPNINPISAQYVLPIRWSRYAPPIAGSAISSPTVVIFVTHSIAEAMGSGVGF